MHQSPNFERKLLKGDAPGAGVAVNMIVLKGETLGATVAVNTMLLRLLAREQNKTMSAKRQPRFFFFIDIIQDNTFFTATAKPLNEIMIANPNARNLLACSAK